MRKKNVSAIFDNNAMVPAFNVPNPFEQRNHGEVRAPVKSI